MLKKKEAHGFYRPENRLELYERMLAFLDRYIGPGTTPTQEASAQ
jgi:dipeptidyl aminopeptidase/acylaminoacyl peptidase